MFSRTAHLLIKKWAHSTRPQQSVQEHPELVRVDVGHDVLSADLPTCQPAVLACLSPETLALVGPLMGAANSRAWRSCCSASSSGSDLTQPLSRLCWCTLGESSHTGCHALFSSRQTSSALRSRLFPGRTSAEHPLCLRKRACSGLGASSS